MDTDIAKVKAERKQLRRQTTTILDAVDKAMKDPNPNMPVIQAKLQIAEQIRERLDDLDQAMADHLYDEEAKQDEQDKEADTAMTYKVRYQEMKCCYGALELKINEVVKSDTISTVGETKRTLQLPKIPLRKFSGELSDWLPYWSQFRTIHEDDSVATTSKFSYLINSLVKGTGAYRLVSGFQITEENYQKAVDLLEERYGDKDLLLQVHIRELLKLFMSTIEAKKKQSLVEFHDDLETHLKSLEALEFDKADPASILFPLVESSLPKEILVAWQRSPDSEIDGSKEVPPRNRLDILRGFLKKEVKRQFNVEIAETGFHREKKSVESPRLEVKGGKVGRVKREDIPTLAGLQISESSCAFCEKTGHESRDCFKARKMDMKQKEEIVKSKNLCFACLRPGHTSRSCQAKVRCSHCDKRHQGVMCRAKANETVNQSAIDQNSTSSVRPPSPVPGPSSNVVLCANQCATDQVLLQTLMAKAGTGWHKWKTVRVFFDPGSQRSYVRNCIAEELGLPVENEEANRHYVFGGTQTGVTYHKTFRAHLFDLTGRQQVELFLKGHDKICGPIPRLSSSHAAVKELKAKGVHLTDVGAGQPDIDILIGSDYYLRMVKGNMVHVGFGLTAVETLIGWVIAGEQKRREFGDNIALTMLTMSTAEVDIKKLWDLEAIGILDPSDAKSKEEKDKEVLQDFVKKIDQKEDGRYVVPLPWKDGRPPLPDNRSVAFKRLESTTKKLKTTGTFESYNKVFKDWKAEGFIEEVSPQSSCHFVPHRPVFKDSPTTPVRPVFDASCKVGAGVSLNDCLETGGSYVKLIPELLLRFRERKFGIISDIRKAFQMVEVRESDRDSCRFLWWNDGGQVIEFRHARVMFGATCSPFILGAVLEFHLTRVKNEDKLIAQQLLDSFYVDNCVTSEQTQEKYWNFRGAATRILAEAKMELRMWMSNGDEFIEEDIETPVLGLTWDRITDELFTDPKDITKVPEKVTKRVVLSTIARIFDPIGFLAPVILPLKMILQRAWVNELKWDEQLPDRERKEFLEFVAVSEQLKLIKIPRLVTRGHLNREDWSLHLFTDASQDAYAAVLFIRVVTENGVSVQLLGAKSRVTPVETKKKKRLTIPRAELLGILIGSRLLHSVKKALSLDGVPEYYWSDSSTAIAWVRREKPWGTFVGNRVREVRELTDMTRWNHVPGELNPADLPSRGCTVSELRESKWWEGPSWLKLGEESWPAMEVTPDEEQVLRELKKTVPVEMSLGNLETIVDRGFTFLGAVKFLGWITRIQRNARKPKEDRFYAAQLTPEELSQAQRCLVKMMQSEGMPEVLERKDKLKTVRSSDGVLCVQTRLTFRDDLPGFKYPVLLPKNHVLTKSLIQEMHIAYHHAGVNFLMSAIRENFWIPQLRRTIKSVINRCNRCYRFKAKALSAVEAPLPRDRVKDAEVFDVVGVDLAGPFILKGGRKAWIVLYTCAVYRAIHLDLTSSLSTPAFIKSLEKFVRRYHRPSVIYSDNGTNFRGADNLFRTMDWDAIANEAGASRIQWKFNPPSAAWWGGWWERMVRSVKDLLRRNLGRSVVTFDEMKKVLEDIQEVINGRPLTYVSEDHEDLVPLTPKMFLNPAGLLPPSFPEAEMAESEKLRVRYRHLQQLKNELRVRFRTEYLGQLKAKTFERKSPDLKVGDIVLIGSDLHKRLDWPLARVEQLFPGRDGEKRVALVRTRDGVYTRPIQRLFKMEVDDSTATAIKTSRSGRQIKLPNRFK